MDPESTQVLERIASWPEEDRQELAEIAAAIEARRAGIYVLTEEERLAVEEGIAEIDRGEFYTEEEMQTFWQRFRAP